MISFILNNKIVRTSLPPGSTLLDFVRYDRQLTGTKTGCREGDCGACAILVGDLNDGNISYQSMTSCLMPLANAQGKHILTVEGINMKELSPVQQVMIENNGTQCGFCTIGFVMSLTGFVLDKEQPNYQNAIKAIDGNICRCTGYKSIERAAAELTTALEERPSENTLSWLAKKGFVPNYLKDIPAKLKSLKEKEDLQFFTEDDQTVLIGGGTDLLVQKPESIRKSRTKNILDDPNLKGIHIEKNICHIGASTTVTEFGNSEIIRNIFPDIDKHLKLVSSSPIRNMATLGGNFVNASPIGDMTIFFLALDSSVVLNNGTTNRIISLKDLYLDYKKLDKLPNEFIESIQFKVPEKSTHFNFEKVCKRTHLDIASVNSACQLNIKDGLVEFAHIAAGGVSAIPKYLRKSSRFWNGKKINQINLSEFLNIVDSEIAPISDARGTAEYKRFLLRQLVLSHFMHFLGEVEAVVNVVKSNS